jgi:hypothetical protein
MFHAEIEKEENGSESAFFMNGNINFSTSPFGQILVTGQHSFKNVGKWHFHVRGQLSS